MAPDSFDDRAKEILDGKGQRNPGSDKGAVRPDDETRLADAPSNPPGNPAMIDGYEILREIHRGGQGVVYLAVQKTTKRKVAIKVLLEGPYASKMSRRRFEREIELVAQLKHPNLIAIFHSGETKDLRQFCVMDYVRGVPLDQFVRQESLSLNDTLALFSKVCDAVNYAHKKGVIHRDLKPSNILVDSEGEPKVLDFGLAKQMVNREATILSMTGQVVGTLPYMSPEQALGNPDKIDTRTDIYALGVILYQMLTDQFPYEVVGNMRDVLDNILKAEPRRPSTIRRNLDNDVETVVLKALSKEPDRRYQHAADIADDLRRFMDGDPIDAKRDSGWYVLRKKARRHQRGIVILSTSFLIAGAAIAIAAYHVMNPERVIVEVPAAIAEVSSANGAYQGKNPENVIEEVSPALAELSSADEFQESIDDSVPAEIREPLPADSRRVDQDANVVASIDVLPKRLYPMAMGDLSEVLVCDLVFERLFVRTSRLDFQINGHLVSSIEDGADTTEKIVRLRRGVVWHDGHELTAEDVVFSWNQVVRDDVGSSRQTEAKLLESVTLEGRQVVKFKFKRAIRNWQLSMNFELIPKHVYQDAVESDPRLTDAELGRYPIGSGPFRFARWGKHRIVLESFREYGTNELSPKIETLTLRWFESRGEGIDAFINHEVDVLKLGDNPPESVLDSEHDITSYEFQRAGFFASIPGATFHSVLWNCDAEVTPLFADVRVRRAMAHLVNFKRIEDRKKESFAAPCYGPVLQSSDYFDSDIRRFDYDRERAARLLDEAGWYRRLGDEKRIWISPSQEDFQFHFELMVPEDWRSIVPVAEVLREDLAAVGVAMDVKVVSNSDYQKKVMSGDFEAAILKINTSENLPLWRDIFASTGKMNFGAYKNTQIDWFFERVNETNGEESKASLWRLFHRLIYDDQPMLFLYHKPYHYAISRRMRGIEFSVRGPFLFDPGVRNWWVEKSDAVRHED